jgi:3-oxoacyl-[acyl-carrier protein] reductase
MNESAAPLAGKVAIVTGAGQGIGRAHARHLAALGASVVVNDVAGAPAVVEEITAAGGRAGANADSVADWKGAEHLVGEAIDAFGDLHIVVNNAGILRDKMSFNMDEADWDAVVDVHLKGHFAVSRHAGRYWRERAKEGDAPPRRIINTTSEAGLFGSAGQANYAAAKGGIVALTLVFAREYERYGVTANVIAPRARTAMTANVPSLAAPADGFDKFDPEHVARFAAWLATDGAQRVSGQVFIVMGTAVFLVAPPTVVNAIHLDAAPWTIEELERRAEGLFGGRSSGVPPFAAPPF